MEKSKTKVTKKKKTTAAKKPVAKKTNTKKTSKKEEAIDKVQKVEALQKVVTHRELKYNYPDGMTDTLERKSWRQKVRAKLNRLEKTVLKAEGRKKTIAKKNFKALQAEVLH